MKYLFLDVIQSYANSAINYLRLSDVYSTIKTIILLLLTFFAPISKVVFATLFLIFVDLITGLIASYKEKQPITSSGLSRSIAKVFIYTLTIILAFIINTYLLVDFGFPIETIVSGFIALTEMKSILENLNRISDNSLIDDLILFFSNERERRLPPKRIPKPRNRIDE
jgi:phage-related holin